MVGYFTAFFDSNYQHFFLFVTVILCSIGLPLFVLKNQPSIHKVWVCCKPWFVMAPLCFFFVGIGGQVLIAGFFLLSLFSIKEFTLAVGLQKDRKLMSVLYISTALIYVSALLKWQIFFLNLPALLFAIFLIVPVLRDEYSKMLQKVGYSIIAIIYLAWFPAHLALLAYQPLGFIYLLFLLIGTELNDASAYLSGKLLGKHQLSPKISPGKTIEGSIGAFVVVSFYVWFVHGWLPGSNLLFCSLSLLLFTVGGTLGDLVMSLVKRDMRIKDMGKLIPGHGGLLDRIDSLLLVSPFYFYMVYYLVKVTP